MEDRTFQIEVDARLENLSAIDDFLSEAMEKFGIEDKRALFDVRVAVDEACTNIVQHAYGGGGEGKIRIRCSFSEGDRALRVRIRDRGRPFDPKAVPPPDTSSPLHERREGGVGMFLMKRLMDDVEYRFGKEGNELTMGKHV